MGGLPCYHRSTGLWPGHHRSPADPVCVPEEHPSQSHTNQEKDDGPALRRTKIKPWIMMTYQCGNPVEEDVLVVRTHRILLVKSWGQKKD
jgi:hypothetical protein